MNQWRQPLFALIRRCKGFFLFHALLLLLGLILAAQGYIWYKPTAVIHNQTPHTLTNVTLELKNHEIQLGDLAPGAKLFTFIRRVRGEGGLFLRVTVQGEEIRHPGGYIESRLYHFDFIVQNQQGETVITVKGPSNQPMLFELIWCRWRLGEITSL